jgi:hypothetical protein
MSIVKGKVPISYVKEKTIERKCDFCGEQGVLDEIFTEWKDPAHTPGQIENEDIQETRLSYKHGRNLMCGEIICNTIIFDICPKCFLEKLIPWAKSLGVEPRTDGEFY